MDWLWYKPEPDTSRYTWLDSSEGWYNQLYTHQECKVSWVERVPDLWFGRPRCFNCGRWVKRH